MTTRLRRNNQKGASMALVVGVTLLIIVAIGAAFKLAVYLSSSQEVKNSVDAALLNVSKRAVEIKVPAYDKFRTSYGFDDVVDSRQLISLANINRAWGKAYLINANAQQMQEQECDPSGYGAANATTCYQNAQRLNDALYSQLTDKKLSDRNFVKMASGKPAKLLGADDGRVTTNDKSEWATACVYRGEESNILYDPKELPDTVKPNSLVRDNNHLLQGYNPMLANDKHFCFVTLRQNEAPHLISNTIFDKSKKTPVPNASNPIPNAFKEGGHNAGTLSFGVSASAVANPMRSFYLTIPHSYVMITLTAEALWYCEGKKVYSLLYHPNHGTVTGIVSRKLTGFYPPKADPDLGELSGYATLGNEFNPATLWQAITALPGDHSVIINKLVQRINQFKPGFKETDLQALCENQSILPQNQQQVGYPQKFIFYPEYHSADLSDPQVRIGTVSFLGEQDNIPDWLNWQPPEGSEKLIMQEQPAVDSLNRCWSMIKEGPYAKDVHSCTVNGAFFWQPGTGFNQCLGVMRIYRSTTCYFTGWPPWCEQYYRH